MIKTYNKYKTGYHFNIENDFLVIIQSLNACDSMSENVVVFILMLFMPVGFLPPKDFKKSLKIPKGQPETVYRRRRDSTMAKGKSTKGQTMIYKTYI